MNKDRRAARPQHAVAITGEVNTLVPFAHPRRLAPNGRLLGDVPQLQTPLTPSQKTRLASLGYVTVLLAVLVLDNAYSSNTRTIDWRPDEILGKQ